MTISTTQQGVAGQLELMKLMILGGDGELEVTAPVTDDERRDLEAHVRGQFGRSLVFQAKTTTYLDPRFKARRLSLFFQVAEDRLISHPLFWYFFAYLDVGAMGFADPVFIVPSEVVHTRAAPHLEGDTWRFNFGASLEADAHDRWFSYRVTPREVGKHVLQLLKTLPATLGIPTDATGALAVPPDILWVRTKS